MTNQPDPNTPLWLLIVLAVLGVLTAINSWLHLIAPRTSTKLDDEAASYLDKVIAFVKRFSPLTMLAVVALASVVTASTLSCTAQQTTGAKMFAKCEETAAINDLTDTVKHIIATGVSTWREQLDALASAYGKDSLACAVIGAEQFFASKQGGPSESPEAAQRAHLYLVDNGYEQ